jgi:hypothetical protein
MTRLRARQVSPDCQPEHVGGQPSHLVERSEIRARRDRRQPRTARLGAGWPGSALLPSDLGFSGGGERIRTADFHVANVALCQLSYTPGWYQVSRGCGRPGRGPPAAGPGAGWW